VSGQEATSTAAGRRAERQIRRSKGAQNTDREKELIERVRSSVGKATLAINAADIKSSSQDALTRVTDGFQDLISRTYTQLKLLGVTYSEQQVASAANPDSGLFDVDTVSKPTTANDNRAGQIGGCGGDRRSARTPHENWS
jgi:hypothetical protein